MGTLQLVAYGTQPRTYFLSSSRPTSICIRVSLSNAVPERGRFNKVPFLLMYRRFDETKHRSVC